MKVQRTFLLLLDNDKNNMKTKTKKSRSPRLNNGRCLFSYFQDPLDQAKKKYPCIKTINYCCGCCLYPESAKKCCWKNYKKVDLSKILNPFGITQDGMCCVCL
jgi:hypothetical protein